jgi:hypothetical protein
MAPPPVSNQSFVEEFDTLQNAFSRNWRWENKSVPVGTTNWMQAPGPSAFMEAYSSKGTNIGCAFTDYQATTGTNNGIISNWMISPVVTMQNGDKIVFYTKTQLTSAAAAGRDYGARMQVRVSPNGESYNTGSGDDHGSFTMNLLDINPEEREFLNATPDPRAYPPNWTRFEATISGLNQPTKGRFAFRYFLHGAGTTGAGNGIGLDSVAFIGRK